MIKRTLYFGNPAYLSLKMKQLVVKAPPEKDGTAAPVKTVPIEDVGLIVIDNRQITLTSGLIGALMDNNIALITCDGRSMPDGLMLPLEGNSLQGERVRHQLSASVPLKKQLWQQTVQSKILNQAACLKYTTGQEHPCMRIWAGQVKSGDTDNMEARAAAYYWRNFFPTLPGFVRERSGMPPNQLLDYGYSILRAIIARALISSGILPIAGIHHRNKYNSYCLADDIMEPYRPFVDRMVYDILVRGEHDIEKLDTALKAELLQLPVVDVTINETTKPLMLAASTTSTSLLRCYTGESRKLLYPVMSS